MTIDQVTLNKMRQAFVQVCFLRGAIRSKDDIDAAEIFFNQEVAKRGMSEPIYYKRNEIQEKQGK